MKKCPYCAEEIQDDAIKCKHCNESLNISSYGECTECKLPLNKNSGFCPSCGVIQIHKESKSSINNLSATKTKVWYKKWWGVLIIIVFLIAAARIFNKEPVEQSANKENPIVKGYTSSLNVRGKTIKLYDTADYVFSVLNKDDLIYQTVEKDPRNPTSLHLKKKYSVMGKDFTIEFARGDARDGSIDPYQVVNIFVH